MLDFKNISALMGLDENQCRSHEVIEIPVPEGIEFMSQWKNFELPHGHVILDKTICGCGFTEYCLCNNLPTILCSPRKILLENKEDQHNKTKDEYGNLIIPQYPIYYFRNEYDGSLNNYDSDGGLSQDEIQNIDNLDQVEKDKRQEYLRQIKADLRDYILNCRTPKIGVTYDSIPHILDVLSSIKADLYQWSVVIDEFQSVFTDASFKSDVELDFVGNLQCVPNVLYLSATPMMDRYLGMVPEFKNLPYYKLIWGESRTETIKVKRKIVDSVTGSCCNEIGKYLHGMFPVKSDRQGNLHESRELVIFLNSVKSICSIIKKCKLSPQQCNIICAKSSQNKAKLNKLNRDLGYSRSPIKFEYGTIPTDAYSNKMFTFCTKTTYIGSDFYSKCASTIVCSNISVETLNLDIALDLPQIVGRQRMKENIFRSEVLFLQQAQSKKSSVITVEEFMYHMGEKNNLTTGALSLYDKAQTDGERKSFVSTYKRDNKSTNYRYSFVGFDKNDKPVRNSLVMLSEIRAYETTRPEYQEDVVVKRDYDTRGDIMTFSDEVEEDSVVVEAFVREFQAQKEFTKKMKLLCEFVRDHENLYRSREGLLGMCIPGDYFTYINVLGPDKIKALSYQESNLRTMIQTELKKESIQDIIYREFKPGERYSLQYIKEKLKEINDSLGVYVSIKASSLGDYFDIKSCKVSLDDGTRTNGYEIIKKKN